MLALAVGILLIAGLLALGTARREQRGPIDTSFTGLVAQTEDVRELPFRSDIRPEYLSDTEMAREIRRAVREEEIHTGLPHEAVLRATRMIPENAELEDILARASSASVLGFYDPETKRLAVESSVGRHLSPRGRMTMVHELTHAVTDQHFDLGALVTGEEPPDELSARVALVEGDASLAMTLWATDYLSISESVEAGFEGAFSGVGAATSPVPTGIAEVLASPYLDGLAFVRHLHEEGGWEAVDAAYRRPPTTTEQILHPEKYLAGELPQAVPPPRAPAGYRAGPEGTVGELFLRTLLAPGAGALALLPGTAFSPVEGWDGGAYRVGTSGRGEAVTFDLRWDSIRDANEFASALDVWFGRTFGDPVVVGETRQAGGRCLVTRTDDDAVFAQLLPQPCPSG